MILTMMAMIVIKISIYNSKFYTVINFLPFKSDCLNYISFKFITVVFGS